MLTHKLWRNDGYVRR